VTLALEYRKATASSTPFTRCLPIISPSVAIFTACLATPVKLAALLALWVKRGGGK
jgi:hypothetical protein